MCRGLGTRHDLGDLSETEFTPQVHDNDLPLVGVQTFQCLGDLLGIERGFHLLRFAVEPNRLLVGIAFASPATDSAASPLQQLVSRHRDQPGEGVVRRRRLSCQPQERFLHRVLGRFADRTRDQQQPRRAAFPRFGELLGRHRHRSSGDCFDARRRHIGNKDVTAPGASQDFPKILAILSPRSDLNLPTQSSSYPVSRSGSCDFQPLRIKCQSLSPSLADIFSSGGAFGVKFWGNRKRPPCGWGGRGKQSTPFTPRRPAAVTTQKIS